MRHIKPYFRTESGDFVLYQGDSREIVPKIGRRVDAVFADPPYFLSNGGFSVQLGKCVSVNKGDWDRSQGLSGDLEFNFAWLSACRQVMSENATIWVCGTFHNIFSVATALTQLDFRILNAVTWQKTNPPPNLSCRFFTHSTEMLVWARKCKKVPHCYNYDLMHTIAGDRQMTDVWRFPAVASWERTCGKHPTQKPLSLVVRALLSCTAKGALILDPFAGSSTTGVAANMIGRRYIGVESDVGFLELSRQRRIEFDGNRDAWCRRILDLEMLRTKNKNMMASLSEKSDLHRE